MLEDTDSCHPILNALVRHSNSVRWLMQFASIFTMVGCIGGAGGEGPVYTVEELVELVELVVELVADELVVELVAFVNELDELEETSIGAKGISIKIIIAIKKCRQKPRHGIAQRNASIPRSSFLGGGFSFGTCPYEDGIFQLIFYTITGPYVVVISGN